MLQIAKENIVMDGKTERLTLTFNSLSETLKVLMHFSSKYRF